ncbi:MAG: DUF1501 domain-containing protein [Dermatophilaceae bacterium]
MDANLFQHPDCPDWRRMGPTASDSAIRAMAGSVVHAEESRKESWTKGFTRRRLLAGGLGVGVAALGQQHVTTRVSYAAETNGSLVVVFLRGGMDGLSVLVPGNDRDLGTARPGIGIPQRALIPWKDGWGLHPSLKPLVDRLTLNRMAAVPAIATPDLSRSHFQAQDCLERGGSVGSSSQTGWLDRLLEASGPGTTWRGLGVTNSMPRSLVGPSNSLVVSNLGDLDIKGGNDELKDQTRTALAALYTGIDHPFALQTKLALDASARALDLTKGEKGPEERGFDNGGFGTDMATLSTLIKSGVGVRVATVDLGGWDMHTGLGTIDAGDMQKSLGDLASGLAAFFADLGDKADSTTVILMSEFGRRIEQNNSSGSDHGHGGVAFALGGGVNGGVHGKWVGLAPDVRDQGDVPGTNDYRSFLGEVAMKRLGLSAGQVAPVFPDFAVKPMGTMR